MLKTIALFFVLGLMVSCASYHHDRGISSVQEEEVHHDYYEKPTMGRY
jgi:hypothetical protein